MARKKLSRKTKMTELSLTINHTPEIIYQGNFFFMKDPNISILKEVKIPPFRKRKE